MLPLYMLTLFCIYNWIYFVLFHYCTWILGSLITLSYCLTWVENWTLASFSNSFSLHFMFYSKYFYLAWLLISHTLALVSLRTYLSLFISFYVLVASNDQSLHICEMIKFASTYRLTTLWNMLSVVLTNRMKTFLFNTLSKYVDYKYNSCLIIARFKD